jgi:sugar lactone lactonase YvrE
VRPAGLRRRLASIRRLRAGARDGIALIGPAGDLESATWIPIEADRPDQQMNDGACDRPGRFWMGTGSTSRRPEASAPYRLVVVDSGRVVEADVAATVFDAPAHPYTRRLLSAVPRLTTRSPDEAA